MDKETVVYVYNGILFNHKKNETLPFVTTWMDPKGIILSGIRQRQILYDFTYVRNLKLHHE